MLARKRQQRRDTRGLDGGHRAHRVADGRQVAQRVVDPFGDEAAVAHAKLGVALEEELHQDVRRAVQLQNDGERAGEFINDEVRDAHAAGRQGRHALFRRHVTLRALEARAGALFVAAPVGGALTVRAAVIAVTGGAAGLLHRKGALFLDFSHECVVLG